MSERGEHNEIGYRNVDEETEHDERGSQGKGSGEPAPDEHAGGAEGGRSEAADKPPAAPADDSSPLGDTDQHSDAGA